MGIGEGTERERGVVSWRALRVWLSQEKKRQKRAWLKDWRDAERGVAGDVGCKRGWRRQNNIEYKQATMK